MNDVATTLADAEFGQVRILELPLEQVHPSADRWWGGVR
jgi:hypothetical protein